MQLQEKEKTPLPQLPKTQTTLKEFYDGLLALICLSHCINLYAEFCIHHVQTYLLPHMSLNVDLEWIRYIILFMFMIDNYSILLFKVNNASFDVGNSFEAVCTSETLTDMIRIDVLESIENFPRESQKVKDSNLTEDEIDYLFSMINVIEKDLNDLGANKRRYFERNMKYINDVLFGVVSNSRLRQVIRLDTIHGSHFVQGNTNYCGFCCTSNALCELTHELVTIKEMDRVADNLWLRMLDNPAFGLQAELEPMRDIKGFYSIEVIKATLEAHGFILNRINDSALIGLSPAESWWYVITALLEQTGVVSLIIRQRHHPHYINVSYKNNTPFLKDSQRPMAMPITTEELGELIINNLISPGAVFFLSKDDTSKDRISTEEVTLKFSL